MPLNFDTAKAITDEAHRAWSAGDLDAVLRTYSDDLWFQRNAVDASSDPLIIRGKVAMGIFLRDIFSKATGMAVVENFQFHAGIGKSRVSYFLKDRETGESFSGTYRQILMFRHGQICRMEQFHDSARLTAFFKLIDVPPLAHNAFVTPDRETS
jgi:ketosteroid isomerase-like protein